MKIYKATRLSLSEAEILDSNERQIARIFWPKVGVWKTKNAPLSEAMGDRWQSHPMIEIGDKKFMAYRKLLTDNFLVNEFEIALGDNTEQMKIVADLKGSKRKIIIRYEDGEYQLLSESFFRFHFKLFKGETQICQMKDETPFFTFSSRREFVVTSDKGLDPILLSFSFFLAHNSFF
ncbi:hypothetical protein DOM21_14675 [Bacteriovorax stolpii]|uniref:hypothetical protein n=1 Tax=Bacteriovorax stolpii TaxID=960 RepID=UPI00115A879C|nr:hypothetical protein [Bacteriovorax stolpii]QDK42671.1 hypothetical protein DOM21_14675 [Bacteriovorax stolpii]